MANWSVKEFRSNIHQVVADFKNQSDELWSLHISDVHWDNPKCDRKLFKRHLDQAKKRKSPVFIYGDFFCAMQGKYDPRRNKSAVLPEHAGSNYLDLLVETAEEYLDPYKHNIVLITEGNHESSIRNNLETDLLDRLCGRLRSSGGITRKGGYQGWVRWKHEIHTKRYSFDLFYHHGSGGGAPVTKGAIDFNRLSEQVVADVFVSGHIHRLNHNKQMVMTLSGKCFQSVKQRDYVRTSTYKQEGTCDGGWAVERRMGPRPLGGYWLKTTISDSGLSRTWIPTDF